MKINNHIKICLEFKLPDYYCRQQANYPDVAHGHFERNLDTPGSLQEIWTSFEVWTSLESLSFIRKKFILH